MRWHFLDLILFSTYAELRAERARSYLGLIWWIADPAMMMGVFWLVFDVILKTGGPGYLPFLLIGLTLWQWIKSCITHGGYAIWGNLGLIQQARLPVLVFPIVQMLADTVKFAFIFVLLLVILWSIGYPPNKAYFALPLLFAATFMLSAGAGFIIAALVPLLPDLRFVIEQLLTVVMFLSGVVFALDNVPPPLDRWMAMNPVMIIMNDARGILMHAEWPNWVGLTKVGLISMLVAIIGMLFVQRMSSRFPKLAV